jgi:hypothetical protein
MIKDMLVLLCIHPEKGWVRRRSIIGYALLAAALFDLAMKGNFRVNDGRIEASPAKLDDPLLDELLKRLQRLEGKKFSWVLNRLSMNPGKLYRRQMQQLASRRLITINPVEWMGITWGKRYRVNRIDGLKPLMTALERVLVYGRKPAIQTRLIIELMGLLGLIGTLFPDGELRTRAKARFREISKEEFSEQHQTYHAIRKELRNALRRQKAAVSN